MRLSAAEFAILSRLLDEAMDLDPAGREIWLDGLVEPFAGAKNILRKMLVPQAEGQSPDVLDTLPKFALGSSDAVACAGSVGFMPGAELGNYRLVELIGRGGMGEVWLAEQIAPVCRVVALKLIRAGMYDVAAAHRFEAERQSLAIMDHPAIAKVFDAGSTAQGQPYLVMEYVPGLPITEYCDRHRLTVRERIALLIQACDGVQHAHQKAILHRDLKPANMLVTEVDGKPVPRIIDFGLAKPTGLAAAHQATHTQFGHFIGTPGYMSPEQLDPAIKDIDTRSDVYSLGVILYVLLTGMQPFEGKRRQKASVDEWLRQLREEDPPNLVAKLSSAAKTAEEAATSRSMDVRQLCTQLRGDLNWITMKAIARERDRRYGTPSEFAADLRRYLAQEPIEARPASTAYRIRKFVNRHRIATVAVICVSLALLGGITTTLYQMRIAENALNQARNEVRLSNQVMSYLVTLFDSASPEKTGGKPVDARALVDQGQGEIDMHFADQPQLRARMLVAVGTLYCKLGQAELCRRDLEQALSIQRDNSGSDPTILARIKVQLASAYNSAGRATDALGLLDRAQPVVEAQRPRDPQQLAAILYERARSYRALGRVPEEIAALEQARSLLKNPEARDTFEAVDILGTLAIAYAEAGKYDTALELAGTRENLVKDNVGTKDVRYFDALNDYAEVANSANRSEEAERDWTEVIDGYVHIYGRASDRSIDAELSLADALFRHDKLSEAKTWFSRAVEDYRIAGTLERTSYTGALGGLAQVMWQVGDYHGAEAAAHEAYLISQKMRGPTPRDVAITQYRWAHALAFVGEAPRAVAMLDLPMPGDPTVLNVKRFDAMRLMWRGDSYREMHDYALARASYDEAIALFESFHQAHSLGLNVAREGKALLLLRQHHYDEASALLRLAIKGYESSQFSDQGPSIAAAKIELSQALFASGQTREARDLLASAGPSVDRELAPTHPARLLRVRLGDEMQRGSSGGNQYAKDLR